MKYLMKFNTQEEYNAYAATLDYTNTPNISVLASSTSTTLEIFSTQQLPNPNKEYLTFTAIEDTTFTISFSLNPLQYSLDGGQTWTTLANDTASPLITAGNKILWKATLIPNRYGIGIFSATGNFKASGNIMSLLYGDNFIGQTDLTGKNYAFCNLFKDNTKLVNAENLVLPATTLANNCYYEMFLNCTSLTTVSRILPATTLAEHCYEYMFNGCTSLTTAPELPATTLASDCYAGMFSGCTLLNYIKCLATNIGNNTHNWVNGVAVTGTFVKSASMTNWFTGTYGIPSGWTVQDAS